MPIWVTHRRLVSVEGLVVGEGGSDLTREVSFRMEEARVTSTPGLPPLSRPGAGDVAGLGCMVLPLPLPPENGRITQNT